MSRLFTPHLLSLQTEYSDLKRRAQEQAFLLVGTPGSVTIRNVSGRPFYYRQYYDAAGKKTADYIGPVHDPEAEARASSIRAQIETANSLLGVARALARGGYIRVDARTDAIVAALANGGLFHAGAVLVGSHAYGVLLNELGVRAAGHATEDVDVARDRALELPAARSFEDLLGDSGLELLAVPQLDRKKPPTSFKPPGADRLRVDLLVPTDKSSVTVAAVPELMAHATALPHFRYVLSEPQESILLGRSTVIPVKVPVPERFAWHKMLLSGLRSRATDKKAKDLEQATVLFAVLAEREPGALDGAFAALAAAAKRRVRAGAKRVLSRLEAAGHERAVELMRELLP